MMAVRRVDGEWFDGDGVAIDVAGILRRAAGRPTRRGDALLAAAGLSGADVEAERRWYVLLIASGHDNAVDNVLAEAGVEHWMPALKDKPRRRSRYGCAREIQPALPGYLFVKVVARDVVWSALMRVQGVLGVIGGAHAPAAVDETKYLKFRAKVSDDPEAIAILTNALKEGDAVFVDDGPFASFPGTVTELRSNARALVEVAIFGRVVPVDLELAQISKSA